MLSAMEIKEIKRHVDGRVDEFMCDLIELGNDFAIVHHVWHRDRPLLDGPFALPAGEIHTRAYFWTDRNFLVYEISLDNGQILGYRFDVCENVSISRELISFDDLELDLWVDTMGEIHVLDEEEVQEHVDNELIGSEQLHVIDRTKNWLIENHQQVIRNLSR